MTADIVLVGYYGRGNFGDDVLMVASYRVARQLLPGATVAIRIGTDTNYASRVLAEDIDQLPFGTRGHHQLILHGGGGTFFDFEEYGIGARALNGALFASGPMPFIKAEAKLRSWIGRPRMSAQARLGLGLGIGTFNAGSRKVREALPVLADFDGLWVRDPSSVSNLQSLSLCVPTVIGSDLAFLWDSWCPREMYLSSPTLRDTRPKVGVVLRDWPFGKGGDFVKPLSSRLAELETRYDFHIISLDQSTDQSCINQLSSFPITCWRPKEMRIDELLEALVAQDVLLTARAHGAICGACLGRPSVIVEIEPKLRAVHEMLPNSTRILSANAPAEVLAQGIEDALEISLEAISEDVSKNEQMSRQALAEVSNRIEL